MKTFTQLINEQAQAKKGNWSGSQDMLGDLSYDSSEEMSVDYKLIDNIKIDNDLYYLFKNKNNKKQDHYILGFFDVKSEKNKLGNTQKTYFKISFAIAFSKYSSKVYGNLHNVDGVAVSLFRKGLGSFMYKYFVKQLKYTILGDAEQYFGARVLWAKLSKELDLQVDLYNTKTDSVIEENVILHHGKYNNDFDARLWSFSKDKHNIRSVLKDIL
jgi:hypothetical protein